MVFSFKRFKLVLFVIGISVVIFALLTCTFCVAGSSPTNRIAAQTTLPASTAGIWVPVVCHGQTIVTAGGRLLPIPIVLPAKLKPLGGVGIFRQGNLFPPNEWSIAVFFSPASEAKVKNWVMSLPHNDPILPINHFRLKKPNPFVVKLAGPIEHGSWRFEEVEVRDKLTVKFLWLRLPGFSYDPTYAKDPEFESIDKLYYGPGSHLRREMPTLQLIAYFHQL